MKSFTESQRRYIVRHLSVDMSAKELARIFRVAPQEIWQIAGSTRKAVVPLHPMGFHSPGGGMLLKYWGIRGATRADAYEPMSLAEFQRVST